MFYINVFHHFQSTNYQGMVDTNQNCNKAPQQNEYCTMLPPVQNNMVSCVHNNMPVQHNQYAYYNLDQSLQHNNVQNGNQSGNYVQGNPQYGHNYQMNNYYSLQNSPYFYPQQNYAVQNNTLQNDSLTVRKVLEKGFSS